MRVVLPMVLLVAAAAPAAELRFVRDGREVGRVDLAALRRGCHERAIEVDDPYYEARKSFRACPLTEVLALGFGTPAASFRGKDVFFRARDGYVKPARGERLVEEGGFVAFADADREAGWEPIDRRGLDPGPFYVVWTKPKQRDTHAYPWPYQLVEIEVADFAHKYPHTVPTTAPAGAAAWEGFAVFRTECIACHAVNGEGGKVGPDLNVPRSIVEYRPVEQLKEYIRDPSAFRYGNMPSHTHLSPAQLDALIAYFQVMRTLKHDPRAVR